jgi:glyoxylase-like metal-dependent hydrolase (beta-lactamase superfamily II)
VISLTAPNPGPKTLGGTLTYVVGTNPAYVIDPGPQLSSYQAALASWVDRTKRNVAGILLTHSHPDHAPGARLLGELLSAPIWASAEMRNDVARELGIDHRFDGRVFPVEEDSLQVIDTPGHSFDHVSFWLKRARILFAGDVILGRGSTLVAPPDGDMALYMKTLERIRALEPLIIAPGHGPLVTHPAVKIEEYIAHRRQRELEIRDALLSGPKTVEGLVAHIYADVSPELRELAYGSVLSQLQKLQDEGIVARCAPSLWTKL